VEKVHFMERLLDGVDVEWKLLGKICSIGVGQAPKGITDGKYSFVNAGTTPSGYLADYNTEAETITTPSRGQGGIGYIDYQSNPFWCGPLCYRISSINEKVITRFVYYVMANRTKDVISLANMTGVPALNKKALSEFEIPIPPLKVQSEIVRILDNFTELTAELTAELSARKKQYSYYRDTLLSFEEGEVEWRTLGEVATKISSGGTPRTGVSEYYNGTIPWLRTQEVDFCEIWDTSIKITEEGLKNSSAKIIPSNCVIVAMYGATVGKIALNKIPLSTNQACANIQLNPEIAYYRYVYHYLTSKYAYIKSLGSGSQTNINAKIIKELSIPIPPLEKQKEIVAILDKFDTLTHSISEGLPREIALRQKQYEYYRNLLLSFPKVGETA